MLGVNWRTVMHIPVGYLISLPREHPDVVLSTGLGGASLLAWLYCVLTQTPLILWSEEVPQRAAGVPAVLRWLRRFLVKRGDGFLAWGEQAERYLLDLGAERQNIVRCFQAVDNDWWRSQASSIDRDEIRRREGFIGKKVVFYADEINRAKGVGYFLDAWARVQNDGQESRILLLAGAGPEKEELESEAAEAEVPGVRFLGAIDSSRMVEFYVASDLFVFPSLYDVWGLVVNEAMAVGVPVLCSRLAGCGTELSEEGLTGETFDPRNPEKLAEKIQQWLEKDLVPPVRQIQDHISRWNFEACEAAIYGAIRQVRRDGPCEGG